MTDDDCLRLIARLRSAKAADLPGLAKEAADALDAWRLERIDVFDTCNRKVGEQRAVAEETKASLKEANEEKFQAEQELARAKDHAATIEGMATVQREEAERRVQAVRTEKEEAVADALAEVDVARAVARASVDASASLMSREMED